MKLKIIIPIALAISCSSRPESIPKSTTPDTPLTETGDVGGYDITTCKDGEKRLCHVTLSNQNGVSNCFVGIQYCEQGEWSPCESKTN